MEILGLILIVIGAVMSMVGGIWIVVIAFQESVVWGLLCLFIGCVGLYYVITHWEETKKPFLIQIAGGALVVIGSVLGGPGMGN